MEKKTKQKKQKEDSSSMRSQKKSKTILPRGRIFKGIVTRKFPDRITIELERTIYLSKFERFMKKKTRIHSRLPEKFSDVQIGDIVLVQECRPLSKMIHSIMIEKLTSKEEKK